MSYSMGNEVNSLKSLKKNNKSSILRLLYDNGAMSRLELAKETGLTTASITVLVKDLMACGAIIESGSVQRNK
ncbi:MAG: winged helix-turn-helix domain-containing protein, partial [Clostridia bacterium]|nr:winged helix-turn-helix domain-containing protein [Clostridia bacterium]